MSKGRDGAVVAIVLMAMVLLPSAHAAVYTVGGASGWTFGVSGWGRGIRFRAGDVLVFNYNPRFHDVVKVIAPEYNGCRSGPRSPRYRSGADRLTLSRGWNYYLCSYPGHCAAAQKIAIFAA